MLNEIINIDLHIHSCFSEYKDREIVKESTIENLDTLITKLENNKISLCSITDHNRFNYELFKVLREKIKKKNGIIKNNLPGIEFDVILESNKPKCHIIAIFDDSDITKLKNIEKNMFDIKKLEKPDEAYTLEEFEKIIKRIGINVILIVHQRQSINNDSKNTCSLSGGVSNPSNFIKVGFIDCLEYNYPRVEGIVKSSLRDIGLTFPIITGSDCHEWQSYPYHDNRVEKVQRDFTRLKCLPTFKGLLMAITSFDTRANRDTNTNKHYIKNISINKVKYPLSNGINAIIGDNGSGKSLLAGVLASKKETCYDSLIKANDIRIEYNDDSFQESGINYIKQGEIIEKVKKGNLFDDKNYFSDITTKDIFKINIKNYFEKVCDYVNKNIDKNRLLDELSKLNLNITPIDNNFYYPVLNSDDIGEENTKDDDKRVAQLETIIKSLDSEISDNKEYYNNEKVYNRLKKVLQELSEIKKIIESKRAEKDFNNNVRAIIKNKFDELNLELSSKRTSKEQNMEKIVNEYENFKSKIVKCVKKQQEKIKYPEFPKKLEGHSSNQCKGYKFNKIAKYNDMELKDEFYDYCFNKDYKNEDAIKEICTRDVFTNALSNYKWDELESFKEDKLEKFIKKYLEETTTISQISEGADIGNTPGEISLVYYSFMIRESDKDYDVLIIDQPEDDINPSRIKKSLNEYLKSIRDSKQVIIITHSPLLVVNLDVDNVIYLTKNNKSIEVKNGALEYENENYSILDLVKDNLDGGYEVIERRLKAYGRNNN